MWSGCKNPEVGGEEKWCGSRGLDNKTTTSNIFCTFMSILIVDQTR